MSEAAFQERFIVAQEIPSAPGDPVGVGGGVAPVEVEFGDATGSSPTTRPTRSPTRRPRAPART